MPLARNAARSVLRYSGPNAWGTCTAFCKGLKFVQPIEHHRYQMCFFRATDARNQPIYHTNVMMALGTSVAVVCLESVADPSERDELERTVRCSEANSLLADRTLTILIPCAVTCFPRVGGNNERADR